MEGQNIMETNNDETSNIPSNSVAGNREDNLQELGIQWLCFKRLKKRFADELGASSINGKNLESVIDKIIYVFNKKVEEEKAKKPKKPASESVSSSYEEGIDEANDSYVPGEEYAFGNWLVKCYQSTTECVQNLVNLVIGPTRSKRQKRKRNFHLIMFFYQISPSPCIIVATTGAAWRVARPYIDYSFPINVADRIADPAKMVRLVRHHLSGDRSKETIDNPSKLALYKTSHLYCLVDHFVCRAKEKSALPELFVNKRCSVKFTSAGSVRILKKISTPKLHRIVDLLCDYMRGEKVHTEESVNDSPEPSFEFLYFLRPASVYREDLDNSLIEAIFEQSETKACSSGTKFAPFTIRHKNFELFLFADNFRLEMKPGGTVSINGAPPAIDDVIDIINEDDKESFKQKFLKAKLKFTDRGSEEHEAMLISCIEGEVRSPNNEGTFFKVRNMWYEIKVDFFPQLHEDLWNVFNKCLIVEGKEGWLPRSWAGTKQTANLTGEVLKDRLNLSNLSDAINLLKGLSKLKVSFVSENRIMQQKLIGEILKSKVVQDHFEDINGLLNGHDSKKFFNTKVMNKVIGNLKNSRKIFDELTKVRAVIRKKRDAENYVHSVINPFPYPLRESLGTKKYDELVQLLSELNKASLKTESEDFYNQSYLADISKNYLVFDRITPLGIELCDILKYTEKTVYLYQVKESFGQHTRDACSQILNAATMIRSALALKQSRNYLDDFWDGSLEKDKDPNSKVKWFEKVKIALIGLGRDKFLDLFYKRRIVFVYAFLPAKSNAFFYFSRESHFVTAGKITVKEIDLLKKSGFLDFRGRLTNKFISSIPSKFGDDPQLSSAIMQKVITKTRLTKLHSLLLKFKPPSNSTIAKIEVVNLAKNLALLGFEFKICEIPRKEVVEKVPNQGCSERGVTALSANYQVEPRKRGNAKKEGQKRKAEGEKREDKKKKRKQGGKTEGLGKNGEKEENCSA